MTQDMQIKPTGAVGAVVANIDLNNVNDSQFQTLQSAFAEHGVLFFRDQNLSPEAHLGFAQRWGEINVNRFFAHVDGHPEIAEVAKEPDQEFNIGGSWHTDHSYDQIPALGSMLLAHDVPTVGGDTLFANCSKAYDSLSDGIKATLSSLRAVHSSRHVFGNVARYSEALNGRLVNGEDATQDAVHPVIVKHPLSGRPTLYVNAAFTLRFEGWTDQESQPLLDYLYAHIGRPEYSYRFQWGNGSMAFWDNRATWHWAINDYHGRRRLMHRVTIEGEALGGI
mgnify:FL=1